MRKEQLEGENQELILKKENLKGIPTELFSHYRVVMIIMILIRQFVGIDRVDILYHIRVFGFTICWIWVRTEYHFLHLIYRLPRGDSWVLWWKCFALVVLCEVVWCGLLSVAALLQQARQEMELAIEKLERQKEGLKQKMQSTEKELHLIIQQKEQTHEEDVERLVRERVRCGHFWIFLHLTLVQCYSSCSPPHFDLCMGILLYSGGFPGSNFQRMKA